MFTGTLLMSFDYNEAYNHSLMGVRVVSLDESGDSPYTTFINGYSLLPPYGATEAMIDNNPILFNTMYSAYLSTEAEDFIVAITAAMLRGKSIMLYLNQDTADTMVPQSLIGFMKTNYGILIGGPKVGPPQYDRSFDWVNLTRLYVYGYIDVREFLMRYPSNMQKISRNALPKLVMDLPPVFAKTEAELTDHYTNYSIDCQKAGKFLVPAGVGIRGCRL